MKRTQQGRAAADKDHDYSQKTPTNGRQVAAARQPCCSRKRCASSAAMQPVPALVMAWR